MAPIDIQKARRETRHCEKIVHFNNAGCSLSPDCVLNSVLAHLNREAEIGGYEAAEEAAEKIEQTYHALANLIHCHPHEIAVLENATRAWDMVFYAIPFKAGDRILTARAEYASNYIAYLQIAQKTGAVVDVIPDDEYGQVCVQALRNMIDSRVKLISITHIPTHGGLVNPAEEIGQIAQDANVLYLLDACQAVGQVPLDVKRLKCDMLSATSRKFLRGPRGTGFLYVKESVIESLDPPFLDLHAATWQSDNTYTVRKDARRFENWETNYAAKIGLGEAARYASQWGIEAIWERTQGLGASLRKKLSLIPGIQIQDKGKVLCGIVTFTHKSIPTSHLHKRLRSSGINTSISSSAYARLDMDARGLSEMVRASVHYYNTEDEIDRFCTQVHRITQGL